jgi:hypothetical protein
MSDDPAVQTPAATPPAARPEPSGWAIGFTFFAACMMVMLGVFQAMVGLEAIVNDGLYVTTPNYLFALDLTTWGVIHLLLGVLVIAAGTCLFVGQLWARVVGVGLTLLSAIAAFGFIPHYPFWAVLIIALALGVIWALTVHGRDITA